ncbi:cytochrome P450 18a1 [Caerostris extrusa]|uniref:Cytochrome P450 18a1 n=1 Tax=Caerostris extrusa TaxID=172846 RepID=A0AAV4ULE7_CAEEX|nr:cytochrome P450 18a1 [Caerostris extrusa]
MLESEVIFTINSHVVMDAEFLLSNLSHWAKTHLATSTLVVALSVGWILHWFIQRPDRNLKLPPGPWLNLPWMGYLPFLGTDFVKGFARLRKKYGPVYRLKLGQRSVLVLNDFPSVKEAFMQRAFLGRPPNPPNHLLQDATRRPDGRVANVLVYLGTSDAALLPRCLWYS